MGRADARTIPVAYGGKPGLWCTPSSGMPDACPKQRAGSMKFCYFALAAVSLLALSGCADYPAAVETTMAQALPPYHRTDTADLDTAQGIKPVESTTHDFGVRLAPFF